MTTEQRWSWGRARPGALEASEQGGKDQGCRKKWSLVRLAKEYDIIKSMVVDAMLEQEASPTRQPCEATPGKQNSMSN